MSALNSLNLIYDVTSVGKNGLLLNFTSSQPGIVPSFFRNDGISVTLRSVTPSITSSRPWDDVDMTGATVILALGAFDQPPDAGSWRVFSGTNLTSGTVTNTKRYQILTYVSGDDFTNIGAASNATGVIFTATGTTPTTWSHSSILQEITTDLAYNISAANLQTALSATAWINAAGGVTVTSLATGSYEVLFTSLGARSTMSGAGGFSPASSVQIYQVVTGSTSLASLQIIEIAANPYAQTQTWTAFPTAAATVVVNAAGSGSTQNVQTITLNPTPYAGTFQITTNIITTAAISAPATAQQVQNALNANGNTLNYTVSGHLGGPYTITTVGTGSVATYTVNTSGLIVPLGLSGTLNLSTYGMLQAFLDSGLSSMTLNLEIQVTPSAGLPVTLLQVPVIVSKNVINLANLVPAPLPSYYTAAQCDANFALLTVAGKYRIKSDGSFELWNATQSLWQQLTITGAAGNETINVGAGES